MPNKSLRERGNCTLRAWAAQREQCREKLGWPALSILGRMMTEGPGASQSTAPGEMLLVERQASRYQFVLRVERLIAGMPDEWRQVIIRKYLRRVIAPNIATELGVEAKRVSSRLHDAQERLQREMDRLRKDVDHKSDEMLDAA